MTPIQLEAERRRLLVRMERAEATEQGMHNLLSLLQESGHLSRNASDAARLYIAGANALKQQAQAAYQQAEQAARENPVTNEKAPF